MCSGERALAFYQCGPSSNPGVDTICELSLLSVLALAPRGFSNSIWSHSRPQCLRVRKCARKTCTEELWVEIGSGNNDSVERFGVTIDKDLTFKQHVSPIIM